MPFPGMDPPADVVIIQRIGEGTGGAILNQELDRGWKHRERGALDEKLRTCSLFTVPPSIVQ